MKSAKKADFLKENRLFIILYVMKHITDEIHHMTSM